MNQETHVVIYKAKDGQTKLDVQLKDETVWLTQKQMTELFDKDVSAINEHAKNIYKEKQLLKGTTIRQFPIVQKEGVWLVNRNIDHYNLDVIISGG